MTKMTPPALRALLKKKPGRHPVETEKGLYFRTVGDSKAYWVFRYRIAGREREMSLGAYPEVKLDEAKAKHAILRAQVLNKADPLAGRRNATVAAPSEKPTFGVMADDYVATHEGSWRNSKHRWQWTQTLTQHCKPIWSRPVDEVATADVLAALKPTGLRRQRRRHAFEDASRW
jgi:Arm DNA-binding domain